MMLVERSLQGAERRGSRPLWDLVPLKAQSVRRFNQSLRLVADEREQAPGSALSDAQLVRALRADDPSAPAVLWHRYSTPVRRLLTRALGPCFEIDDVTQEVFLRAFVRLPALRDPSALRAFVLSIAANVLKWEIRRRWVSRKIRLSESGMLPDIPSTAADPEARQALQRCYAIFDTLTANERLAFVLRFMEGMTTKEVAAALCVSISTAKRLVSRASAKVAEQVAQDVDLRSFFVDSEREGLHER